MGPAAEAAAGPRGLLVSATPGRMGLALQEIKARLAVLVAHQITPPMRGGQLVWRAAVLRVPAELERAVKNSILRMAAGLLAAVAAAQVSAESSAAMAETQGLMVVAEVEEAALGRQRPPAMAV